MAKASALCTGKLLCVYALPLCGQVAWASPLTSSATSCSKKRLMIPAPTLSMGLTSGNRNRPCWPWKGDLQEGRGIEKSYKKA